MNVFISHTCESSSLSSLAGWGTAFGLGWGAGASFCNKFTSRGDDMATVGAAGGVGVVGVAGVAGGAG